MDMAKAQMAAQPDNIMMLMMLVLPVATQVLAGAHQVRICPGPGRSHARTCPR